MEGTHICTLYGYYGLCKGTPIPKTAFSWYRIPPFFGTWNFWWTQSMDILISHSFRIPPCLTNQQNGMSLVGWQLTTAYLDVPGSRFPLLGGKGSRFQLTIPKKVASRLARQTCPLLKTHPRLVKRYLVDRNLWKFDIDQIENYRAFGFSVVAKTISNRNITIGINWPKKLRWFFF